MAGGAAFLAIVGVGADEHVPAMVIEDDLVEIDLLGAAERAGLIEMLDLEGMVLEIEAHHFGMGRHGIDALSRPAPKSCSASDMCILGLSNFGVGEDP